MHDLSILIAERVRAGLKRKSVTTCSRWACAYRVMGGDSFPGPWTFKHHPWLEEMHDANSEIIIGQKSAQMGFTEYALNLSLYSIDVKNRDVLYVLPAKTPDASDFSSARFDPALELSPHLQKLFSDVKNIGHKRAGTANLYIRGSKSRAGLKSIPVGLIVLDEVNEMKKENIPLAMERASGQIQKQVLMISTPTIKNHGINKYYIESTMEHFFFKCPSCSKFTELTFPECLEIVGDDISDPRIQESYIKCRECKIRLEHKEKYKWLEGGKWIPSKPGKANRGFQINQLYSSAVLPGDFAIAYLRSLKDAADEQEFFNSKLGETHIVSGAAVLDEHLDQCRHIESYRNSQLRPHGIMTLGVDVGKYLHYEVDQWIFPKRKSSVDLNIECIPRVLQFGKVKEFEELDRLMVDWKIHFCVIDANPERRKAYEFASRWWKHVKLCLYSRGINGKQIHSLKDKTGQVQDEHTVQVDRTSWLDLSLGRFKRQGIILPFDIDDEYKEHIKALVRVYDKDADGNPVGRYENGSEADHYAHARNYSEIALPFAASFGVSQNIDSPV